MGKKLVHPGMDSKEFVVFVETTISQASESAGDKVLKKILPLLSYDKEAKQKTEMIWGWFGVLKVGKRRAVPATLILTLTIALTALILSIYNNIS